MALSIEYPKLHSVWIFKKEKSKTGDKIVKKMTSNELDFGKQNKLNPAHQLMQAVFPLHVAWTAAQHFYRAGRWEGRVMEGRLAFSFLK